MRIGVVSFLNSKPYALGLEHIRERDGLDYGLFYAPPKELSRLLESGELDVALIPAYDHLCGVGAGFVPGHGIASAGSVDTVRLFYTGGPDHNGAIPPLDVIHADERSASSVALLRLLLADYFKQNARIERSNVLHGAALPVNEGLLIIGDQAQVERPGLKSVDLGEVWTRWTGLPFVYALWAVNDPAIIDAVRPLLDAALHWSETHREQVIAESARVCGFDPAWVREYLNKRLIHRLGDREMAGLGEFARRNGLAGN